MKAITFITVFFVMVSSNNYIKIIGINKIEYPVLILSSVLGMPIMISATDLITVYIGLELQSLALYVLAAIDRDNIRSTASGVKYMIELVLPSASCNTGLGLL